MDCFFLSVGDAPNLNSESWIRTKTFIRINYYLNYYLNYYFDNIIFINTNVMSETNITMSGTNVMSETADINSKKQKY